MMRGGAEAELRRCGEILDGALGPEQLGQEPEPARRAEGPERLGELLGVAPGEREEW
jgi:hypothetical protein